MQPYWSDQFGNPSSISHEGVLARGAVENARAQVARVFGVTPRNIVFTSGGTESNNLAIAGFLATRPRGHVIASRIEHPSVKEPIRAWEVAGGEVTWLDAQEDGTVDPKQIRAALRPDTLLVTLMWANNETGVWQPVREVARIVKNARGAGGYPHFHVDACQGPGSAPLKMLADVGVDTIAISAQKFYGPKGAGVLYVRTGAAAGPLQRGGGHEYGLRAGTENVPLIVGTAVALELCEAERESAIRENALVRDYFEEQMLVISGVVRNGSGERVPHMSNLSFEGVPGELMVLELDAQGIAVSTGSACGTKDADPSVVLRAMGFNKERAGSAVRFSFCKGTSKEDVDRIVAAVPEILERHRSVVFS